MGAIEAEVSKQCAALPRGEFASKALGHSFTVFAKDMVEVIFRSCQLLQKKSSICDLGPHMLLNFAAQFQKRVHYTL